MIRFNRKFILITLVTLVALVLLTSGISFFSRLQPAPTAQAYDTWYDADWSYRKKITIDHTKVSATLTDFPVLINLTTDAELASSAQDDGDDILFTIADETTKLSHEIELFDGATGQLVAWVKVPSLSSTVDTDLYLYYGNSSATDQQNGTDVWSNGYQGVWHLKGTESLNANDSTTNTYNLTNVSTSLGAGKIGDGAVFDGTASNLYINSHNNLNMTGSISYSAWINGSDFSARSHYIMSIADAVPIFSINGSSIPSYGFSGISTTSCTGTIPPISTGSWYYLAASFNQAAGTLIYTINGSVVRSCLASGTPWTRGYPFFIGKWHDNGPQIFAGTIDESHMVSTARSSEWIATEYNNQNSPSTFYSLDTAQERETTPPTNPTTFKTYSSSAKTTEFTNGGWGNAPAPYFEWSGADDDESGVDGYYLYLGTNSSADPEVTSGIIEADNSPHYTTSSNFTLSQPMVEDTTYYFRIKTKDNALNVSSTGDMFTYSFETSAPDPPEYINVSPAGCSTANDFTFTWPVATDNGDSGIAGYQYKKGAAGSIQTVPSGLTLSETAYQDSDNVLYLRSRDNAGNVSIWQTAVYCTIEAASVIDGPDVTASPTSLIISWRSNKETTGYVEVYEGNTYLSQFGINTYSTDHTVSIIGLKSEQSYRYRLSWKDSEGNTNYSDWYETTTAPAPKISDFAVSIISPNSIIINFLTSYLSTATLEYGKDTNYGNSIDFSSLSTAFSRRIDNLEAGTNYTMRIIARSEDGTEFAIGKDFTTPSLPTINDIRHDFLSDRATVVVDFSWSTNVATTSSIFYRLSTEQKYQELSINEKTTSHKTTIENLADDATYQFYLSGIDEFGNIATSDINTFQTPLDTRPPTITDIVIETSNVGSGKEDKAQAVISYSTDEPAKCLIEYAIGISGDSYSNKTPSDDAMSDSHLTILSDLTPQTPYHFRIICDDKGNNQTISSSQIIISGEVSQSVFALILKTLNNLFGWIGKLIL